MPETVRSRRHTVIRPNNFILTRYRIYHTTYIIFPFIDMRMGLAGLWER